jgi:4-diphosphocytidyl-2-C-methyl-D-erythritol kinase
MVSLKAFAPAKVNLFLHVGAVKANGRHDLDSLVMFSDNRAGDHLTVELSDTLSLDVSGPFASASGPLADNLVLRAAQALKRASGYPGGARIVLKKWLPVAAGIGGGSSDAAMVLRLLTDLWQVDPGHAASVAPTLGGDVPVVLDGVPALMRGEGERVTPVRVPAGLQALLVNPGKTCPTGPVFAAYDAAGGGGAFEEIDPVPEFADTGEFIRWLEQQRNDLETAAIGILPEIADVLDFLRVQPGVRMVRMSGSGATCFALFDVIAFAERASVVLKTQKPDWWTAPCRLGAAS